MKATIESLKKNPLFALSESSKELYHSNMLAWLLETFPKDFSKIFGSYKEVKREKKFGRKSVDIALLENEIIVGLIEVKVKDILTSEQASQYDSDSKENFYISLFSSPPVPNWKVVKFSEIAEILRSLNLDTSPESAIVTLYIRMLQDLDELVKLAPKDLKYSNLFGSFTYALNEVKLAEAWKRHFGTKFISEVKTSFKVNPVSINNKHATLTFETEKRNIRIGIQLENKYLRKFAQFDKSNSVDTQWLYDVGWFKINGSQGRLELCTYSAKNNQVFKYQWEPLNIDWTPNDVAEYLDSQWKVIESI